MSSRTLEAIMTLVRIRRWTLSDTTRDPGLRWTARSMYTNPTTKHEGLHPVYRWIRSRYFPTLILGGRAARNAARPRRRLCHPFSALSVHRSASVPILSFRATSRSSTWVRTPRTLGGGASASSVSPPDSISRTARGLSPPVLILRMLDILTLVFLCVHVLVFVSVE